MVLRCNLKSLWSRINHMLHAELIQQSNIHCLPFPVLKICNSVVVHCFSLQVSHQCWGMAWCCLSTVGKERSSGLQSSWQSTWLSAILDSASWEPRFSSFPGTEYLNDTISGWWHWEYNTNNIYTSSHLLEPEGKYPLGWGIKPFSPSVSLCHAWVFGETGCLWYGIQGFVFGIGSLLTTCLISLDRCLKICCLRYGKSEIFF